MKPVNFDPAKKYPIVLWIHGGPWSMYSVAWNWAWQNFAANGYGVLWTNPRGSTGYGQDFVNGIQFSYPGKDYDDLMAGVDAALAKGWVDKDNLFVCGGSGGGVLTAWIVGHTDRFRAAVSMRPVINWHSFVGTTDGINWYHQFQKYPWEDPMEYAVRSPLHYVGNVRTPTMVMTGEADLRTPISQSEEYLPRAEGAPEGRHAPRAHARRVPRVAATLAPAPSAAVPSRVVREIPRQRK